MATRIENSRPHKRHMGTCSYSSYTLSSVTGRVMRFDKRGFPNRGGQDLYVDATAA